MKTYKNPILSGFYPDPSICRVESDFYITNSTFAYFPGLPIFHSKDLRNWKQIGNAIDRPGQLNYDGHQISQGLFAPTIRYNKGIFYILCTLINTGGNFVITAKNPQGPWSDPIWLENANGIDPSIFFDDDGRVWYCGTRPAPEGEAYPGNYEIYIWEMDLALLEKGKNPLIGEGTGIWRGALRNVIWPEGPHIYKINGWYYLLHAEAGTSVDHAICIARAKNIHGPWEGKKSNPILTHRYLGKNASIINVGHADIVDDTKGNWWMILLASRPFEGVCPLGRETFMVPFTWEDEWPLVASKTGLIESEYPLPCLPSCENTVGLWRHENVCDHFSTNGELQGKLPLHWLTLRMPVNEKNAAFCLSSRPNALRLFLKSETIRGRGHPSFAGRRIRDENWAFSAAMEFSPKAANESAGIILLQSEDFNYRLELYKEESNLKIRVVRALGKDKEDEILASQLFGPQPSASASNSLVLAAKCEDMKLSFHYGTDMYSLVCVADNIDAKILSTEFAGGFVGTLAGLYASGNGKDTDNFADFFWAEYRKI